MIAVFAEMAFVVSYRRYDDPTARFPVAVVVGLLRLTLVTCIRRSVLRSFRENLLVMAVV